MLSGLNTNQVAAIQTEVAAFGRQWHVKDVTREVISGYWVHLPPAGGREGADQRVTELRSQGVNDLFIVQEAGPNQYAVSLGLFKTEASANVLAGRLRDKGVRGVLVMPRMTSPARQLEVRGPDDRLPDAVARLVSRYRGASRHACTQVAAP